MTATETNPQVQQWVNLAQQLRVDSIRCTTTAGSGHPTSSMSAADLMAVLMSKYLHYGDVGTGSLGQGLPIGVGIATVGKYIDKLPYKVFVILGDSEMTEGSI